LSQTSFDNDVMNQLDSIEEVYNMYSENDKLQITEVAIDLELDFDLDLGERPANSYLSYRVDKIR